MPYGLDENGEFISCKIDFPQNAFRFVLNDCICKLLCSK